MQSHEQVWLPDAELCAFSVILSGGVIFVIFSKHSWVWTSLVWLNYRVLFWSICYHWLPFCLDSHFWLLKLQKFECHNWLHKWWAIFVLKSQGVFGLTRLINVSWSTETICTHWKTNMICMEMIFICCS